jgi:hypothetical protein
MKISPTKIFLFAAGLATCALLLAEGSLRVRGKDVPPPYPPRSRHPELQAYEPYGFRLIPSRTTTILYPTDHPRVITLVSNGDGFRASRELDEADARPRILFLGDGLVSGDGIEESERFTNVLETLEPSRRMDNLGMTSYGPDLMLRSLQIVGLKLKPALVVFCMDTDGFRRVRPEYDGAGFAIPKYKLESGHLVSVPYPAPNFENQLRISVAISKVLWNRTTWQWDLNQAILDRFEELGDQQHFQKVIMFLPGTADTTDDQQRRSWLRQYASRHATPFLDPSDAIHKVGKQAFIPENPHYNPVGHQVLARELDRFLRELLLPSA